MYSQEDISPNTLIGLNKTLDEIDKRLAGKRKDNPVTIEEAKIDVNNHNIENTENKRRRILSDPQLNVNISNIENEDLNPINLNNTFDQNKTINFSMLNDNIQNNNVEVIKQLKSNIMAINQINSNLSKMSSLKLADYIDDEILLNYHNEMKINHKNLYELKCIIYKLQAHIAAGFIPRYDRIKGFINKQRIINITKENYDYIINTLNGYAAISKDNQIRKYRLKEMKKNHYEKVIKIKINEYENKIKDKIKKLAANEYKFNN